ncbi:MAG TPA: efflux RND transporter periplasmic adaptor subunit [Symbiobacteriaceae bacterium]|nr:efflux RND transporter periplasmic adaptor subunit [Symbiobacteriaceae bacterium]
MQLKRAMTAAAVLAALTLTTPGCGLLPKEEEEAAPALAAPPVKTEKAIYTVKKGSIEEKVSLRAIWAPVRGQDLFYKNGGRVKAVYVQSGDKVQQGQVLAELFADDAEFQLAKAEIALEKVKLAIADAKYKDQFNSSPAVDSELKRLELDLKSAQMDVDRYQKLLAETRLVAPFGGIISAVSMKVGENVAPYAVIARIEDPSDLWIEADVSESDLVKLAVGQKVRLEFTDAKDVTEGTLVELPDPLARATAAGPAAAAKKIKVRPTKHSDQAKMSMVGKVHVILQQKNNVLLLDKNALRTFGGRSYVLTREPRREVDVKIGIEGETESEILSGLKEGEVVIGR